MQRQHEDHRRSSLLPAGRRWGFGAHSVVPYLTDGRVARGQQAAGPAQPVANPVFQHMEHALRLLRRW